MPVKMANFLRVFSLLSIPILSFMPSVCLHCSQNHVRFMFVVPVRILYHHESFYFGSKHRHGGAQSPSIAQDPDVAGPCSAHHPFVCPTTRQIQRLAIQKRRGAHRFVHNTQDQTGRTAPLINGLFIVNHPQPSQDHCSHGAQISSSLRLFARRQPLLIQM